jgi:hypothetical protein
MRKITLPLILAMSVSFLHAVAAQAQATRTFISGQGIDTNPCSVAAPCRNLAPALAQTVAGGTVYVLNSAGYGTATITKAVSIVSVGAATGMLAISGGTSLTISAGPNDVINLCGLDIEGAGSGAYGIVFNSGQSLNIEKSIIRGFTSYGIDFAPNSGTSNLFVSDTIVANNGAHGVLIQPSGSGAVNGVFTRVRANQNGLSSSGTGIYVYGGSSTGVLSVTVADSVLAGNHYGVAAASLATAPSAVMIRNSTISNNSVGIVAQAATVFVGQTTLSGNTTGWQSASGGVLDSYGNNNVNGNATNGTPTGTISLQ